MGLLRHGAIAGLGQDEWRACVWLVILTASMLRAWGETILRNQDEHIRLLHRGCLLDRQTICGMGAMLSMPR